MSGRAALWFVLQKYVVEAGALQQVGLSRLIGLTFSGDLGLFLDSLDKILTELVEPASEDLVSTLVVPQLREASKIKTYHSLAVDIDIFVRAATGAAERSIEFLYRCARQYLARIDRETMRTSLVTSVVSNTIQRVLRSPVVLTKKAKTAKARERVEKWFSLVDVTFRSVSDT